MRITILYFARIKEAVSYSNEQVELPDMVNTVQAVKVWLAQRGEAWAEIFNGSTLVRAAINHSMVEDSTPVKAGDELAFFPPVTGG